MTARTRGAVATVLLLALLTACGESGSTFTAGDVTVIDEAGLVTGVAATEPPGGDAYAGAPLAMPADGKLDEVVILWLAGACDQGSVLRLRGNALTLSISPQVENVDPCGPRPMAITLRLNRVIDASSITFTGPED